MNIFDKINIWIEDVENSIVTLITTLIPWLAPMLPAYFTFYHLANMSIPVPPWVAISMALAVEFLGFAAISTAFEVMRHNKETTNRKKANQIPLGFPVGAYIFYIIIVLTVNVLMELPLPENYHQYTEILSIALLSLVSVPAFVIVISRHQRREIDSQPAKKPVRTVKISATDNGRPSAKNGSDYDSLTVQEIMQMEGVSERTAYRRKANSNGKVKVQV